MLRQLGHDVHSWAVADSGRLSQSTAIFWLLLGDAEQDGDTLNPPAPEVQGA